MVELYADVISDPRPLERELAGVLCGGGDSVFHERPEAPRWRSESAADSTADLFSQVPGQRAKQDRIFEAILPLVSPPLDVTERDHRVFVAWLVTVLSRQSEAEGQWSWPARIDLALSPNDAKLSPCQVGGAPGPRRPWVTIPGFLAADSTVPSVGFVGPLPPWHQRLVDAARQLKQGQKRTRSTAGSGSASGSALPSKGWLGSVIVLQARIRGAKARARHKVLAESWRRFCFVAHNSGHLGEPEPGIRPRSLGSLRPNRTAAPIRTRTGETESEARGPPEARVVRARSPSQSLLQMTRPRCWRASATCSSLLLCTVTHVGLTHPLSSRGFGGASRVGCLSTCTTRTACV